MTNPIDKLIEQLSRIEDKIDYILNVIDQEMTEDDYDDADISAAFGAARNGNDTL